MFGASLQFNKRLELFMNLIDHPLLIAVKPGADMEWFIQQSFRCKKLDAEIEL